MGVTDSLNTLLSDIHYCTKFRRCMSSHFGVGMGSKNLGTQPPAPFGCGRGWPPRNTLLPNLCYNTKFGHSRSNHIRAYEDLPEKCWPLTRRLSRSLKVIGTDTDRSATYDFLLVFNSNYSPIAYHFGDNWRYLQKFPTPLYLTPPLRGFLFEFCKYQNDVMRLPECQKCDYMSIRVYTVPALDRRTE